jgi:hypothetical protein
MKDKETVFDRNSESVELEMVLELTVEEMEAKVAPDAALGVKLNHNETLVEDQGGLEAVLEPTVEELEGKIAPAFPGVNLNHNETLIQDNA